MKRTKTLSIVVAATLLGPAAGSATTETTSPQCRGVAAGVVATMRAAGELPSQEMVSIARSAAHRACEAASENQSAIPAPANSDATPDSTDQTTSNVTADTAVVTVTEEPAAEEPTIWELLSRDRELKPGNKRLRRLKQ